MFKDVIFETYMSVGILIAPGSHVTDMFEALTIVEVCVVEDNYMP